MFKLDLLNKKSIHEQIVEGFKTCIVSGEFSPNDKLPSVRDLSASLTVNPNTIAKAFRTLESESWIYTVPGRGCFVSETRPAPDSANVQKLYSAITQNVKELKYMGISEEEIIKTIIDEIKKGGAL
ncbi:MAG: GntR family transcriptional regulator [Bacillota bacterium]|nr:GntR family transcriptional regulator [Bacillota bacterium]